MFSGMPLDQAHEQKNKAVKGAGGAVGLIENPVALKRCMMTGPEQAIILSEFDNISCTPDQHTLDHERKHDTRKPLRDRLPTCAM